MPGPTALAWFALYLHSLHLPIVLDGSARLAEEAGLAPAGLACAGFDATFTGRLLDNVDAALPERSQLASARGAIDSAVQTIADLHGQLELAPGDDDLRAYLAAAFVELASARSAWQAARQQLAEAGSDGHGGEVLGRMLECSRAAGAGLPPAFGAAQPSEAEAQALRLALIAESRAERRGEPVPDDARALLQRVRSDPAVVNAQAQLDLRLGEVRAVWSQRR